MEQPPSCCAASSGSSCSTFGPGKDEIAPHNIIHLVVQLLRRFRLLFALLLLTTCALAQEPSDSKPPAPSQFHGRLLLVLPFENRTTVRGLDWVDEAFPDVLNRRLDSAGFLTIGRGDRLYAFDHLGLPPSLQPSRAMTIRLAQMLDVDYVVFGRFTLVNNQLTATAQILDVSALRLQKPVVQQGQASHLLDVINSLAWQVTRRLDPTDNVEESTFLAADGKLHTDAFEHYIQGVVAPSPDRAIPLLQQAVQLAPHFNPALLALGLAYFSDEDYNRAATTLGRLPINSPQALRADFYRGLAFFYTGNYRSAEDAFAFVRNRLPLPEVVNNEGVAAARRGKNSAAFFRQAIALDPRDSNYHFNLAVALWRQKDASGALKQIEECLKLSPDDSEAQSFEAQLRHPVPPRPDPDPGHAIKNPDDQGPLERIKRTYDEAGFRQAAFELEQVQEMRLASMPPDQRAAALVRDGDQFFQRGLVLEAEREYRKALSADANSALAHAGLAAVRERDGDPKGARQEATISLGISPNVPAWLVLARLDLQANHLSAAAQDVSHALKIDPGNADAKGIRLALAKRGQQLP